MAKPNASVFHCHSISKRWLHFIILPAQRRRLSSRWIIVTRTSSASCVHRLSCLKDRRNTSPSVVPSDGAFFLGRWDFSTRALISPPPRAIALLGGAALTGMFSRAAFSSLDPSTLVQQLPSCDCLGKQYWLFPALTSNVGCLTGGPPSWVPNPYTAKHSLTSSRRRPYPSDKRRPSLLRWHCSPHLPQSQALTFSYFFLAWALHHKPRNA